MFLSSSTSLPTTSSNLTLLLKLVQSILLASRSAQIILSPWVVPPSGISVLAETFTTSTIETGRKYLSRDLVSNDPHWPELHTDLCLQ